MNVVMPLNMYACCKCATEVQAQMWFGRCPTCGGINTMRLGGAVAPKQTEAKPKRKLPPQFHRPKIDRSLQVQPEPEHTNLPWIDVTVRKMKEALESLRFSANMLSSALTPNSALLRFQGNARFTVDAINRKRSELLTTYGLNVISVHPEPGAISLAVARPEREIVTIESVWDRWQPHGTDTCNTKLAIGVRESDGSILFLEPETKHAPHTLIAGSTGSGKSVLMQNLLLSIAQTNTPKQAEIILIDPKLGVDYFAFDGLPHMKRDAITEQGLARQTMVNLVNEMERRYREHFKPARVANLAAYNAKVEPSKRLPVIWLIHDEFSEWMMIDEYKQSISNVVSRLGVKARAAGIYLIFAAQRPDANVMPMQLRANLGNRLILRVDSTGTSEIALGESGAEQLLGRGHMIAKLDGEPGLQFAQVPYVNVDAIDVTKYDENKRTP